MKFVLRKSGQRRSSGGRGFSLVELLFVISIIICISVVALPTMLHVVADVRTRTTMSGLSGLVQECRSYAIKNNKYMTVHFTTVSGQTVAYIQDSTQTASLTSALSGREFYLGRGVTKFTTPSGPPAMTGTSLWGSSYDGALNTNEITFNSRGLPCYYNTGNVPPTCDLNNGFVYYFTYQPPFGANGWTALSISPAGRIKNWVWTGSYWGN